MEEKTMKQQSLLPDILFGALSIGIELTTKHEKEAKGNLIWWSK